MKSEKFFLRVVGAGAGEEVDVGEGIYASEEALNEFVVTANGDALVGVVEIIIVIDKANGQAFDDERRQLAALAAPLLLSIFLDEFFEDILTDEH